MRGASTRQQVAHVPRAVSKDTWLRVGPRRDRLRADPADRARNRRLRGTIIALVGGQAVAFVVLVLATGRPHWGVARATLVLAVAGAASAIVARSGRWLAGTIAVLLGVVGTAAGLGIGVVHLLSRSVTVVSVSAAIALVTGVGLWSAAVMLLVGHLRGRWRTAVAAVGVLLVVVFAQYPVTSAVIATNRAPTTVGVHTPADVGLTFEHVTVHTDDGVALSAWYIPATNGAAVVMRHGAGSTKAHLLEHAAVLAEHGYGALLMDARGHGDSGGVAMDYGWHGDRDIAAGVSHVADRPDVAQGRVAVLGLSMGGEEALGAAAADRRITAVVAEGVSGRTTADLEWLPSHPGRYVNLAIAHVRYTTADLLTSASPPTDLRTAVEWTAPRPVLLIAASGGIADEVRPARWLQQASPDTVAVWEVPRSGHVQGLATDARTWEARVVEFLDHALRR